MIEPILSLSLCVHANREVYALLLGSGISRSARIPTGWDLVLDLVRQLAHLSEEDCEPEPRSWYEQKYGEEPDYSKLLEQIAKSSSERNQLLRSYFEPTDEEREEGGIKVPTQAHRAIAELVKNSYIKVIVTTNFDRLLEIALRDIGIEPTVISTSDSVEGALPLQHTKCTIIKVHGDYLDTRIKNTPSELAAYDEPLNCLLDKVFDEYGLIICGWSGDWDEALRDAIRRCKSRRFTTFWAARRRLQGQASELLNWRQGVFVPIKDADSFFTELNEKVQALEELNKPHPLSAKIAVATLKKYLVDDSHRIRLHDLVTQEVERVYEATSVERFPVNTQFNEQELIRRLNLYESISEILISMFINGCYWGQESHQSLWINSLDRLSNLSYIDNSIRYEPWHNLRLYPALLLFYSGGIAALANQQYNTFYSLLFQPIVKNVNETYPAILSLSTTAVLKSEIARKIPNMQNRKTPLSDYINDLLKSSFQELLPDENKYQLYFDLFEYIIAIIYTYELQCQFQNYYSFGQPGRFAWKRWYTKHLNHLGDVNSSPKDKMEKANWNCELTKVVDFLLELGYFQGVKEEFLKIQNFYGERIDKLNWD
ncbi:hypothetical protein C7H19_22250 [Aphanothece hegewaldii CCALA 016]|uniref:Uncharacterized protein n=2 Tax=Aphanothece TaxID=1121 RepID=A0A2T1LRT9_9CHRO|nr:hypothetical protein C7H19_22250 [Aphanothece hegewaldii CCALA 016]